MGALEKTPVAATAEASVSESGHWTFYGDLPNPVWANDENPVGIPDVDDNNTYSPLRRVNYGGNDAIFNAIIVKWGDQPG